MNTTPPRELVLASASAHRRMLLQRLQLPFAVRAANVDETPLPGESATQLAARLAAAKARVVADAHTAEEGGTDAVIIGSDQVAECAGECLGKPGSTSRARAQLAHCSGRPVRFHTAVCVIDTGARRELQHVDLTTVEFRVLTAADIDNYLAREDALDCAGSFKSEGLGISLTGGLHTDDPTALIGLPLIWVSEALRAVGMKVPPPAI